MHFLIVFLLAAVPHALAQYGDSGPPAASSSAAASTTASSSSSVHTVDVGNNGNLAYSPNTITAAVGETIEFHFFAPSHSVAESEFNTPCLPPANGTGFFSGVISTSSGQNTNVFTVTINDTNPIWFYCVIPTHCQSGMVGVINPPADGSETLAEYQSAAAKAPNSGTPANVQGGIIGPVKAATTSTGSGASPSGKSAGVIARGGVQWVILAITGAVAVVIGRLVV